MYGTAVLQVTHKSDVQVVQFPLGFPDGIHIKQSLCRVLVCTISCIDDRNT